VRSDRNLDGQEDAGGWKRDRVRPAGPRHDVHGRDTASCHDQARRHVVEPETDSASGRDDEAEHGHADSPGGSDRW
jgi:hypothetical protein